MKTTESVIADYWQDRAQREILRAKAAEAEVDFLADAYQDVAKLMWEALDKQDALKDELDALKSHFAYCTRGC